jgi:hypothetical protein
MQLNLSYREPKREMLSSPKTKDLKNRFKNERTDLKKNWRGVYLITCKAEEEDVCAGGVVGVLVDRTVVTRQMVWRRRRQATTAWRLKKKKAGAGREWRYKKKAEGNACGAELSLKEI